MNIFNTFKSFTSNMTSAAKKPIEMIAQEVIAGQWSAGKTRKKRLTKAGYNYNAVQKE